MLISRDNEPLLGINAPHNIPQLMQSEFRAIKEGFWRYHATQRTQNVSGIHDREIYESF